MSGLVHFAELIRERGELELAIDFIRHRIALEHRNDPYRFDPYRFAWSCEPFFDVGYRILAVELRG